MAEGQDDLGELVYLDFEDALEILAAIIGGTTRQAADQLRSPAALEGALGWPAIYAHYEQADVALQATVLAHAIAETQAFLDGNKRVALVAMLTFLELNGHGVRATDRELADWMVACRHPLRMGSRQTLSLPALSTHSEPNATVISPPPPSMPAG